jgi:DNA-binding transcriptional ArsR family regulator
MTTTVPALISLHLVRVVDYVRSQHGSWVTAGEIAEQAGMAGRTARSHARALAGLGIFDRVEVFPGYRYRFIATEATHKGVLGRIEEARTALL